MDREPTSAPWWTTHDLSAVLDQLMTFEPREGEAGVGMGAAACRLTSYRQLELRKRPRRVILKVTGPTVLPDPIRLPLADGRLE